MGEPLLVKRVDLLDLDPTSARVGERVHLRADPEVELQALPPREPVAAVVAAHMKPEASVEVHRRVEILDRDDRFGTAKPGRSLAARRFTLGAHGVTLSPRLTPSFAA